MATVTPSATNAPPEQIVHAILILRGQRVILDRDLARLYGVTTKRFNEAVKRNLARFPQDFMFQLSVDETAFLRSQIATSKIALKDGRGGARYRPYAFTEHGAIQAANILSSERAISMSVYVVRAFVQLREILASNKTLARKLLSLEQSLGALDVKTQRQLMELYALIRQLMGSPAVRRRGIGFTADLEGK